MSEKEKKKAKEKRKLERAAHADLIDYREYAGLVANLLICSDGICFPLLLIECAVCYVLQMGCRDERYLYAGRKRTADLLYFQAV